jgi:F-type H+-transporting ATPase subunit delta
MTGALVSGQILEPYAEALMSIAQSNNLTEQFGEDFRSLLALIQNSPELRDFLENPVLKPEDKKAVIRRIAGEGANSYLVNFFMLLVDRRRIIFLEGIGQKYLELLRKLNNIVLAEVTAAVELNDSQKQSISAKVQQMTGAQSVELGVSIDPSLIGGVIIKVGSQVLDASLRGQLRRITLNLGS